MAGYPILNSDPNVQSQAALLDQRQALAQALMQAGMSPMGGTEMVGPVAIRRSPMEGLAKMLQMYQGNKMLQETSQQRAALAGQAYQAQLEQNQPQGPAGYSPDQVSGARDASLTQGSGPTQTNAQAMAQALMGQKPAMGRPNPRNPLNAPAQLLTDYQAGLIPKETFDAQMALFKPTEASMAARQGNMDPVQANQQAFAKTVTDPKILAMRQAGFTDAQINAAMMGETAKAAEIDRKAGNQFYNPFLGASGMVPKIPENANPVGGVAPNGALPGGVQQMAGTLPVAQNNAQASSTGSANGGIMNVTTSGGATIPMRAGAAIGAGTGAGTGAGMPPATPAPPMGAGAGILPQTPARQPVRIGQTTTDAAIQKTAADQITSAPALVTSSKGAITGLEGALQQLDAINKSGAGAGKTLNMAAYLNNMHIPLLQGDVDGYQTMQKLLQNSLNSAAQATGAGGSDARFESFMHGQPNAETMNPKALNGAIRYVLSQHDAAAAKGQFIQDAYQKASQAGDPNAAMTAQSQWSKAYNPTYFAFNRMEPGEQTAFLRHLGKEKAMSFMGQYTDYGHQTGWVK